MPNWPNLRKIHTLTQDQLLGAWALMRTGMFSSRTFDGRDERPVITPSSPLVLPAVSTYLGITQVAGPRLSQTDEDVFCWLLGRAYQNGPPCGDAVVTFTREEAIKALTPPSKDTGRRSRGGNHVKLLDESLRRLYAADFQYAIKDKAGNAVIDGQSRLLSCVEHYKGTAEEPRPQGYQVIIAGKVAQLLEGGRAFTLLGEERLRLKNPMGKWLYSYYKSQAYNYPNVVTTAWLKEMMDKGARGEKGTAGYRKAMQESMWLPALDAALKELNDATGWECQRVWNNEKWKVQVVKGLPNRHDKARARRRRSDADEDDI